MHVHLDPVGGVAGDMFVAALLDAFPELADGLRDALAAAGLDAVATLSCEPHHDGTLTGARVVVRGPEEAHPHRAFADIRRLLTDADLAEGARDRALDIFARLARAEGAVHGCDPDEVTFHEVGAWDSILDIVASAWLVDASGAASWSVGPLPLGGGRVDTAHGTLPVPAPATATLLVGFPCVDDGVPGERVTPTGAAILGHLEPSSGRAGPLGRLLRMGTGFGSRRLEGIPNLLRALVFEGAGSGRGAMTREADRVAVCEFEVDDQTAEDLAVALDRLRDTAGVLDVVQVPALGKRGRLATGVRLLARPERLDAVLDACFLETSTLGIRWHLVDRAVLPRADRVAASGGRSVRVKTALRPDGRRTEKAQMGDLVEADGRAGREALRRAAERPAMADEEPS